MSDETVTTLKIDSDTSGADQYASAMDRVLEVTVGGFTGFFVSFLVFPSRAHALTTDAAADTSTFWYMLEVAAVGPP